MSQSTKRKHVTKEVLDEFRLPANNERIVQVVAGRGNNLHEVYDPHSRVEGIDSPGGPENANKYLVSMPTKFRKNVWIKRGDFVVVEPIEEGDKVKAEIVQILYKEQIKYIKEQAQWPSEFSEDKKSEDSKVVLHQNKGGLKESKDINCENTSEEDSDDETDLFQNTNRPKVDCAEESSDTSSSEGE